MRTLGQTCSMGATFIAITSLRRQPRRSSAGEGGKTVEKSRSLAIYRSTSNSLSKSAYARPGSTICKRPEWGGERDGGRCRGAK